MSTTRKNRRLVKKGVEKALTKHPCGPCAACCTTMQVAEIAKAEGARCPNLVMKAEGEGCGIYSKRPESCRSFNCVWRVGLLDSLLPGIPGRPDQLGLLFDINNTHAEGIHLLVVREIATGAVEKNMKLLHELAAQGHVMYLIEGDRRRMMGPEERVNAVQEAARRRLPLHMQ